MRRVIVQNGSQKAIGQAFSIDFTAPPTETWRVRHLSVSVPNYLTGIVTAVVTLNGVFVCGTLQGQQDSADGEGPDINPSQILTVTWSPTRAVGVVSGGLVQGRAMLIVDQGRVA